MQRLHVEEDLRAQCSRKEARHHREFIGASLLRRTLEFTTPNPPSCMACDLPTAWEGGSVSELILGAGSGG